HVEREKNMVENALQSRRPLLDRERHQSDSGEAACARCGRGATLRSSAQRAKAQNPNAPLMATSRSRVWDRQSATGTGRALATWNPRRAVRIAICCAQL